MTLTAKGVDLDPIRQDAGLQSLGGGITETLRVSPNGRRNIDGSSWTDAFTTIPAALDACSTDEDDLTLIVLGPHTTQYDIARTGNPEWGANVILKGMHRNWTTIRNTHASASSIMRLTGKSAVADLNFNLYTRGNGLIMTRGGCKVYNCQFVGTSLTSAAIALWLDSDSRTFAEVLDCGFFGHTIHMTAIRVDQFSRSNFQRLRVCDSAVGIQIVGANADMNSFRDIMLHGCPIALDLDAGNEQMFDYIEFHGCTVNVDDEVGDHYWTNIFGAFPISIEPDNLTGVQVNTGVAGVYGGDTQIRAAVASTVPFRIVGIHLEPSTNEWYQVRFSADSGITFYDTLQFDGTKREGIAAPSGTEFIFNAGTRISASARDVSGGNNVKVWLEIQEI